jgi:hypothetical protein
MSRLRFACLSVAIIAILSAFSTWSLAQDLSQSKIAETSVSGEQPQAADGIVSPTSFDFGKVLVGKTSPQLHVSLKNTGDADMTVSSVSISGNYAIPVNHCAAGVKPGTHCDVYVTFTPQALNVETGTLTFNDNATNSPQTVSLTGTGSDTVATLTKITASPKSFLAGQPVTLTATVTSLGGGVIPNGDQVVFSWAGGTLGTGMLQGGVATITSSGVYWDKGPTEKLVAQFEGDTTFQSSQGIVDVKITRYTSTVTVTSSPNPSMYLQPVMITGHVTSSSPFSIGGHMFLGGLCGSYELVVSDGVASHTCKEAKDAGTYVLQADYLGDGYNEPGSGESTQVVNPSTTNTVVKSSKNPSVQGHAVTLLAVVTAPWAHVVVGSVTFESAGTTLGTVELKNSRGEITISTLPTGKNTITATYTPGNGNFQGSSGSLVQTVN